MCRPLSPWLVVLLLSLVAGTAPAQTWNVTTFSELVTAMSTAAPGDLILVQPGVYPVTLPRISIYNGGVPGNPITVRGVMSGGQRPVLDAQSQDINRGILHFWPSDTDWVVENLEFKNAHGGQSYSQNAAAAYVRGDRVTIRNCYSHHNDNGWFSSSESEELVLEGCETAFNGTGTGYTHNHYINSQSVLLRGCYVHDSIGGINYKDRSWHTVLEGNLFVDAGGYDIDWASEGAGNALMIGNVVVRLSTAGNHKIINVGDGTGVRTGTITLINNTIVTLDDTYRIFERHASSTATLILHNNVCHGSAQAFSGTGWTAHPTTGAGNWFLQTAQTSVSTNAPALQSTLYGTDPGFTNLATGDYSLTPSSPCRDSADPAPLYRDALGNLVVRRPLFQFQAPQSAVLRPGGGLLDRGALEAGSLPDLAVAGSFSIATQGPVRVGLAGAPGDLYGLFADVLTQQPPQVFPGITGALHLSPAPLFLEIGRSISPSGVAEHAYPLPGDPAFLGVTIHLQTLRYAGPSGAVFSTDVPSFTLGN